MIHSPNNDLSKISESLSDAKTFLEESIGKNIKFINVSEEPSAKQYHEAMANLTHAIMDAARLRSAPRTNLCREEASSDITYPIFIGGSHKSGTTLLRNLLDGHESLNVLPGDGHGIRYAERLYSIDAGHHEFAIVNTILHCTAMPIAGEQPRWVLGSDPIDYVRVGEIVRQKLGDGSASAKQIFDILAHSFHELSMPASITQLPRKWVEKSTNNIEDAYKLFRLYPRAKFLHIVRHPGAIIAAQKRKQSLKNREYSLRRELETIHQSMRYGLSNKRLIGNEQYHIIRFEELVSDTENTMRGVAKFLDISYSEILMQPTVFGKYAGSNTSRFDESVKSGRVDPITSGRWKKELFIDEVNFINSFFGSLLDFYGYAREATSIRTAIWSLFKICSSRSQSDVRLKNNLLNLSLIAIKCRFAQFYHRRIIDVIGSRKVFFNEPI
ncbi:MAG: sulfotransferase [Proteobacteria bacterium]|nr:sulfotransferase [Pseudomonadota bacterium]